MISCAEFAEYEVKPTIYTYNELRVATQDFHPHMKLGKGGYGTVYKVCAGEIVFLPPLEISIEKLAFTCCIIHLIQLVDPSRTWKFGSEQVSP